MTGQMGKIGTLQIWTDTFTLSQSLLMILR